MNVTIDQYKVWEAVTGSDFAHTNDFAPLIEYDTWKQPCNLTVTYYDDYDSTAIRVIEPQELVTAYEQIKGSTHCGTYKIDVEDYDACFASAVLQHIIYGE